MISKFSITDIRTASNVVYLNGAAWELVSQELRTETLAFKAVSQNPHAFEYVLVEHRAEAVLRKALKFGAYMLRHIPDAAWCERLALKVIEINGLALGHIPKEFCSESVVTRAVQSNGLALEHVPSILCTQSLVDLAVANCAMALKYAPAEFRMPYAGNPYRFNYQGYMDGNIRTTCIVPTQWLDKSLPTMGGDVVYTDNIQKDVLRGVIFEFSESALEDSSHTICLQISRQEEMANSGQLHTHTYFDAPVKIYCNQNDFLVADKDWCIEVVLLNHLLAPWYVGGYVANDLSDIVAVMRMHPEFVFEFGIGETQADIVPGILERVAGCVPAGVLVVMTGDDQHLRLALFDLMESFGCAFEDATLLIGEASVIQVKMLISALVGCKYKSKGYK